VVLNRVHSLCLVLDIVKGARKQHGDNRTSWSARGTLLSFIL
jgi:hypothetical protein